MHSHLRIILTVSKFQFGVCAEFVTFSVWTCQATPLSWLGQAPRGGPRVPSWPGRREFRAGGRQDTCRGGACCPLTSPLFSAWFWLVSTARARAWPGPWGWSQEYEGQPEPPHTLRAALASGDGFGCSYMGTGLIGRMRDLGRHPGRLEVEARRKEAKRRVRKVQSGGGTRDKQLGRLGKALGSRCSARLVQDVRFPQTPRVQGLGEREERHGQRFEAWVPSPMGVYRKASGAVTG